MRSDRMTLLQALALWTAVFALWATIAAILVLFGQDVQFDRSGALIALGGSAVVTLVVWIVSALVT